MDLIQFPGRAGRMAKQGVAACAVLATAVGLTFTSAAMADSSGMPAYAPISGFGTVGSYSEGLSTGNQKWPALTFNYGASSSQGGGSQAAVALPALDSSVLARNIQVGLNAGTTAIITGNTSNVISTAGNTNTVTQSSNVFLLGK